MALAVSATMGVGCSALPALELANPACRGQTVHHRHLQIHQHDVEALLPARRLHALGAVVGNAHLASHALEEAHRDFLVDRIVFDQQHVALIARVRVAR